MKYKERQLKWFWYWINERYSIYEKRNIKKLPYPWTKDKILCEYKFTNVFRQLDRVTEAWTDRWCRLLHKGRDMKDGDILFQLCVFRFFNWPETYDKLFFGMSKWHLPKAKKLLDDMKAEKKQIFTGAYIITAAGRSDPKHHVIAEALDDLWDVRHDLAEAIVDGASMRHTTAALGAINTVGPFIGYEIACDLRHTRLLQHAKDIHSWANTGPGAKRGISRLVYGNKDGPTLPKEEYVEIMRDLLLKAKGGAVDKKLLNAEWPFEMREIEHSLCEFDKMMRVRNGEGRPRSKFIPPIQRRH